MAKWWIVPNVVRSDDYNEDLSLDIDNVLLSDEKKEIVLCVGKVQSGKTRKIIKIINDCLIKYSYDIIIVFAGITNYLYNQTNKRILDKKIENITYLDKDYIGSSKYDKRKRYVINILKNRSNLEQMDVFLYSVPNLMDKKILIIDDESDYASVNISKNGYSQTYNKIKTIYNRIHQGKLIQVTATPFANIISNKSNELKPDRVVIWSNSSDYTGLKEFNKHKDELYKKYDVHKSDLKKVKDLVKETIEYSIITILNNFNKLWDKKIITILFNVDLENSVHIDISEFVNLALKNIRTSRKIFYEENQDKINLDLLTYDKYLNIIYENIDVILLNSNSNSIEDDDKKIKIYIGGTMISRGNTFKNLLSELILNSPGNEISVDTLLQRARWFGYRKDIMKLMRIFMSNDIYNAFIEAENYLDILTVGKTDVDQLYRAIQILDKESKYIKSTGKE